MYDARYPLSVAKNVVGGMHILYLLKTIMEAKFKGAYVKASIIKSL